MKKILLATTAVVALTTVSAEAFAAEKIKLSLGGFMRQYVALTNHDEVAATADTSTLRGVNLGLQSNSEVYFRGSTKLDNGLSVAVDIQLESSTRVGQGATARKFDVVSMEVSSDAIGAVTLGSTTHAADDFLTRAPLPVGSYDWGDTDGLALTASAAGTSSAAYGSAAGDITDTGSKGLKLKYVSPNFSGVNVYASYTANDQDGQITGASSNAADAYTYGIAFGGEVGGASVAADVTHMNFGGNTENNHVGLSVGMAGFTVAGGYTDFNEQRSTALVLASTDGSQDGSAWELGVGYETGPYSIAAAYMTAKRNNTAALTADNKDKKWQIGATYDLGAGVALSGVYWNSKATTESAITTDDFEVSGFIAGIEVGF
ncbi:MAG: hypothetical protein COB59_04255 [Rhodospirillaceae bacterium]|nr:MAG: hypothetical protein COB59_04255 [Rhodospirillaceae bacterium]